MLQNEELRAENVFLYAQREQLQRQHEDVIHDNEKVLRQLQILQQERREEHATDGQLSLRAAAGRR